MTNETITINLLVEGSFNDYNGNYSVMIPVDNSHNEENVYFLSNEPIFIYENGNKSKCIWKEDTDTWWIGDCGEIGQSRGFAFMKDCTCPWPR